MSAAFESSVHGNTVISGSIITNTGQNHGIMAHQVNIGSQTRSLSTAQTTAIMTTLQQHPLGQCDLSAIFGNSDAGLLVDALKDMILASGTNIRNYAPSRVTTPPPRGIVIETSWQSSAVMALFGALQNANLTASVVIKSEADIPHIFVGANQ